MSQPKPWPADESRIDIIGQNGNSGEHYGHTKPAQAKPKSSCPTCGGNKAKGRGTNKLQCKFCLQQYSTEPERRSTELDNYPTFAEK